MKNWSYIGMALIIGNALILRGALASELTLQHPYPSAGFFRLPFTSFRTKPQPEILSPVTVRLFAGKKLQSLWIKNKAGLLLADHRFMEPVSISIQDQKLSFCSAGWCEKGASELVLRAADNGIFELKTPQGSHRWTRGELILRLAKDHLLVINRLGIEDYVSGILEGELGSLNLSPEVLKAQIVVARTYTLSMRGERHAHEGYEFCDQPHCQVFSGIPVHHPALEKIIGTVRKEYISYKGRPIAAFYHHNCGGMTSAVEDVWPTSSRPYLKAVLEPADSRCLTAPQSHWRVSLSKKSLAICFRKAGWLKRGDDFQGIQVVRKDRSGRVEQILILSHRPVRVTIGRFRNTVNQYYSHEFLKSALFTIATAGDSFIFNGRGWGHGVGLCQEGAMWMARHGKTYRQILLNYFPHTEISKLN